MKKFLGSFFWCVVICFVVAGVAFSQCCTGGFTTKSKKTEEVKATVVEKVSDKKESVSEETDKKEVSEEVIEKTVDDAVDKLEDAKSE